MSADLTVNLALLPSWLDPEVILRSLGPFLLPGLCLIIFAECGLLLGFFLPGDSLLFTAGLFVALDYISPPLWLVCLLLTICAFVGNVVGYWIGEKVGPALFNKPDSKLFKQEHVVKTHEFFERYGPRAIVLARFVPIIRTFITAIAGVGKMDKRKFFVYSGIGAVLWATGVTVLGYFLGQIPFVHDNLEAMILLIVFVSILPIIFEVLKARREKKRTAA
ncbi:membrane-associated protein [Actinokineospora alba]|uniref:Membrane-associated protein n=1 Tax=Actinokineospora alba TaxID=504798 RepID=A0A1H0PUJ5_9PSEU|nr:VTT domain-containing protein [Actinokineospora alba]TDP65954.1 membrane-associated protein [Actinokineospora alba]SDI61410.1 membrane-associated protein [Actinokineospora alba]SDP08821.1 membrane-associated protein [Actinokineospora alba]